MPEGSDRSIHIDSEPVDIEHIIDSSQGEFTHFEGQIWTRKGPHSNDGVKGKFHCPICISTPHDSVFKKIPQEDGIGDWKDWFSHNASAGGPCESARDNTPQRVLQWRYILLTDSIKIGNTRHRVVMYLKPPTCDEQTMDALKTRVMDIYTNEMHWVCDVKSDEQDGSRADEAKLILSGLQDAHKRHDSVAFVVGFPKSISNNMTKRLTYPESGINPTRYVLKANPRDDDSQRHLCIFEENPIEELRDEILSRWPETHDAPQVFSPVKTVRFNSLNKIEFRPTSEDRVLVTDTDGTLDLSPTDYLEDGFLNRIFLKSNVWEAVDYLRNKFNEGRYQVQRDSVQFRSDARAAPRYIPNQDDFTHVIIKPRDVSRSYVFVQSGARLDSLERTDDEDSDVVKTMYNAEFQTERKLGTLPDGKRIHALNIFGSGYLTLRGEGLTSEGSRSFVRGRNHQTHDCRLVTTELSMNAHISILKNLLPDLADYEAPSCIDVPGIELYADMFRHVAHQVLNLNNSMPPHRLSRTLSLFRDLTADEDNFGGPARDILTSVFEVNYGGWGANENQSLERLNQDKPHYRLSKDAEGWFGKEGSEWKLLFDVRSCGQLYQVGLHEDELQLLPNGMRMITTGACARLGLTEIKKFPHSERLPSEPYSMLRACFNDENLDQEVQTTHSITDWVTNQTEGGGQRRLYTIDLGQMDDERWGRLSRKSLERKDSHPNGWTAISEATLPLSISDNQGAVMEFNCIYVYNPESLHVRGAVDRDFFLTLTHGDASRSVRVFRFLGGEGEVPEPWWEFAKGLQKSRDARFFRYSLLNDLLRAFLCSFHRHQPLPFIQQRGSDLLPHPHRALIASGPERKDSESLTAIKNLDPELGAFVAARIRSDFWLPEDCS